MNLKELINHPKTTLVDVREPWEYAMGHVEGSVNIPLNDILTRPDALQQMSAPLVLFCQSGNRSGMAQAFLQAQGVKEVYNGGSWHTIASLKVKKAA